MKKQNDTSHIENDLDIEVKRYLQMDTNYATMITGPWGIGKTYYFDNILKPNIIERTPVYGNQSKNYIAVRISLFGIDDLNKIYEQIFLEMYPLLKSRGFGIGSSLLKLLLRGWMNVKMLGNIDDYMKEIQRLKKDSISVERLVICFDDLERHSSNLEIKTIIGFINTLVESGNIKVIILANDKEKNLTHEEFEQLKEKTIGIIIPFKLNLEDTFDQIIVSRYSGYKQTYLKFLTEHKSIAINIFKRTKDNNLRKLIYGLDIFQFVYSDLYNTLLEEVDDSKWKKIWKSLFGFTIAASIEYRSNKFVYGDEAWKELRISRDGGVWHHFSDIESNSFIDTSIIKENNSSENFGSTFFTKYNLTGWRFYVYPTILDYVCRGSSYKIANLLYEIKEAFPENMIPYHYQIWNSLLNNQIGQCSDEQFLENTRKVVEFAKKGEFNYYIDYLNIFIHVFLFNDILGYNIESFTDGIKRGMRILSERLIPVNQDLLEMNLDVFYLDEPLREIVGKLSEYAFELNKERRQKQIQEIADELLFKFINNKNEFYQSFNGDADNKLLSFPYLAYIDLEKFWEEVTRLSAQELYHFMNFITQRCKILHQLKEENKFFIFIHDRTTDILKILPPSLSRTWYTRILSIINSTFIRHHNLGI